MSPSTLCYRFEGVACGVHNSTLPLSGVGTTSAHWGPCLTSPSTHRLHKGLTSKVLPLWSGRRLTPSSTLPTAWALPAPPSTHQADFGLRLLILLVPLLLWFSSLLACHLWSFPMLLSPPLPECGIFVSRPMTSLATSSPLFRHRNLRSWNHSLSRSQCSLPRSRSTSTTHYGGNTPGVSHNTSLCGKSFGRSPYLTDFSCTCDPTSRGVASPTQTLSAAGKTLMSPYACFPCLEAEPARALLRFLSHVWRMKRWSLRTPLLDATRGPLPGPPWPMRFSTPCQMGGPFAPPLPCFWARWG